MATLSELVNTVAKATGLDQSSVALIARHAREAGLIAMSGRGPSAASMGLTDAVNLLIAVNTVKHASEVARAIPLYRQLVPYERDAKGHRHVLEGVGRFGEILEQLTLAAGTGIFPDPFLGKQTSSQVKNDFAQGKIQIAAKFNVTFVAAALRIVKPVVRDRLPDYPPLDSIPGVLAFDFFPPAQRRGVPYQYFRGPGALGNRVEFLVPVTIGIGNRIEEMIIGHPTFRAIGQLIAPTTA
jgi:hypothetical protein